jgi:hypothetical protein
MNYIEYFQRLYKEEIDLNETYFRLNHIISNFQFLFIENTKSLYPFLNKQVIFINKYNKGYWKQKLIINDIETKELDIHFNFINLNSDDEFMILGQFVLDEFKNIIFIIQDNYFFSKHNSNDIQERIKYLQKIFENNFIYSQLDIFVFKFIEYKYFTKENIEYLLKTTLLNNEIKMSIESIEILNRNGHMIKSIECKHLIHLNVNEWHEFVEKNQKSIHFTIYKHNFDLNTNHNSNLLTNTFDENKVYNLYTIKKGIDIFYINMKDNEILQTNEMNLQNQEQYYLVYILNIDVSKKFNKIANNLLNQTSNKFLFNYTFNKKLNKFIPIMD